MKKPKMLLIGWDAADWKVIHPLLDAGEMPALKKLIERGVMGNIATLEPVFSPMLWTSIATGKYADKHGILGFTEPDTHRIGIRPVSVTSRKCKAIWNILMQNGYKTNVIGWWPSHPAEPVNGVYVSNMYQRASKPINEKWPMLPGTVHPKNLSPVFKKLRLHPGELTEAHVLPFIPDLAKINQDEDKRLEGFLKILADTASIHNAATWTMENTEWDFMAVYYDAIDHFSHLFMKFHPPMLSGMPEDLFALYKNVVASAYKFHDMMLERLLKLAGDECTILLLSDHGFHSDHNRPVQLPKAPAAPAYEHRAYGIFCMAGENIKKDELVHGINLLDIAPTVLQVFGLPAGKDMDGKVIVQAFENLPAGLPNEGMQAGNPQPLERIASWDEIPGNCGMHPEGMQQDAAAAQEALKQLVDLGYIENPGEDMEKAVERTITEQQVNLARMYMGSRRYRKAIEILETIYEKNKEARIATRLARCYYNLNENEKALHIARNFRTEEDKELPAMRLLEGQALLRLQQPKEALQIFRELQKKSATSLYVLQEIGNALLQLKRIKQAEKVFQLILEQDPDTASAHHGLSIVYIEQGNYEEAAEAALNAIHLAFEFPMAHYHLGIALSHLSEYEHAAHALEIALTFLPNLSKARQKLIDIYTQHLKQPDALKRIQENARITMQEKNEQVDTENLRALTDEVIFHHKEEMEKNYAGEIIVVSGLPRSGTSMMMQLLDKGGVEIFSDHKREADENNPKGYFEHEAVKALARDKSWLPQANGKAVKIISHLLPHLPLRYKYKVIFMHRNFNEVLASQHKMLLSQGKIKEGEYRAGVEMAFKESLKRIAMWEKANPNVQVMHVKYAELIADVETHIPKIEEFIEKKLNREAMKQVVDKNLYRNKLNT